MTPAVDRRTFLQSGTVLAAGASSLAGAQRVRAAKAAPDKIKVGQIGVGHAHASKLGVFRSSADYEVVGIAEPNDALRRRAEGRAPYQDLPWMTVEQLLNVPGLQLVLVETEVAGLLDAAETCISAGKHIHLDKPAGADFSKYQQLLADAKRQQLLVQMGYMYRYNPAVVLMREMLAKGWLGEPFEVHTVMSKVIPDSNRRKLAEFSGGTMFELGCHILDLTLLVLGKPQQVHAFVRHSANVDDGFNDNMLATLEYPQALATVKSTGLEVDGFARRHFVVCGTEGTLHIQPLDSPDVRLTLSQPRDKYPRGAQDIRIGRYARYVGDAADMAQVIRGQKQTEFTYEHDLNVQRAVLQASGMPVG